MRIYIRNIYGEILVDKSGRERLVLEYDRIWRRGDAVVFETETPYVTINLDPHLAETHAFIPGGRFEYAIPFGEKRTAYHPDAFSGPEHRISLRITESSLMKSRRNLALNSLDKRNINTCYPHSDANVMTRDEAVFESRNAIDGYCDTRGHGEFPFQSWGGGLRDDLEFELYFGRGVIIDEIALLLRADYRNDHDINWESGTIEFSDGSALPIEMMKTTEKQCFKLSHPKMVEWIKLNHLKREISSAFSALSQIEVYGKELFA